MTQITFTGDVGRVAAAANSDASIIWYCYERPYNTGTSIFVQRYAAGVLEAEVRFLAEGQNPEIFFDATTSKWIFLYTLNEKLYMIMIDETTPPATQGPQTGTVVDHYRMAPINKKDPRPVSDIAAVQDTGLGYPDGNNTPLSPYAVSVGASGTPGMYVVRWRAYPSTTSNLNINIAGFNIYIRRSDTGAIQKLNQTLVPYVGLDPHVYEFEVPPAAGAYYVSQVNYRGDRTTQTVEGRIRPPVDNVGLNSSIASLYGRPYGSGKIDPTDLSFTFVDTAPLTLNESDTFRQNVYGAGLALTSSYVQYTVVQVVCGSSPPISDTYRQSAFGAGMRLYISGVGLSSIIVG